MKCLNMALLFLFLSSCLFGRDIGISKSIIHDVDYTRSSSMDTLYLTNLTNDTIAIDSIYLDSFQIVNGKEYYPYDQGFGVGFHPSPRYNINYAADYLLNSGYLFYRNDQKIRIVPKDSLGLTYFDVDNTMLPVMKRLAKEANYKYGDTLTLHLIFKTTTSDTVTCIGIITKPPTNIQYPELQSKSKKSISEGKLFNAKGQKIKNMNYKQESLNPEKTFIQYK